MLKSYLKFLSRNKTYTAIDVFGLAISFAFLILIGTYLWQETHIDKQHHLKDRIYMYGIEMDGEFASGSHWRLGKMFVDAFPEIENACGMLYHQHYLVKDGVKIATTMYLTDPSFFEMFDFPLVRGDRKQILDEPNSMVVTEEYARKVWGNKDPIGQTITMIEDSVNLIVTGIMEPFQNTAFQPLSNNQPVEAIIRFENARFINYSVYSSQMNNATATDLFFLAKPGTDLRENIEKYQKMVDEKFWIYQLPDTDYKLHLIPFNDRYFSDFKSSFGSLRNGNPWMVKVLSAVALLILFFAITNYINLTVAQAAFRAKEMATRRLVGASRIAIFIRLILESAVLCSLSLMLGIGLSFLLKPYANNLLQTELDIIDCLNVDTILIASGIFITASVLAGIIPAILISNNKPIEIVRGTFRRRSKMIFSKVFIIIQNMTTITMVALSLIMILQINHLINAPLGYNIKNVISFYPPTDEKLATFKDECRNLSCVEYISLDWGAPLHGGNNNTMTYQGHTISIQDFYVTPDYMKIYEIPILKDSGVDGVYVNRQLLEEFGLDENATEFPFYDTMMNIKGIIDDIQLCTIEDESHPIWIWVMKEDQNNDCWHISIRIKGNQQEAWKQICDVSKRVLDYDPVIDKPYLEQTIEERFDDVKRLADIVVIFTVVALVISLLGLVAMSTYFVEQREREIAIRKVFGSQNSAVLTRLLWQFAIYILISFIIACPIIYYLGHLFLSEFKYTINISWWIYAVAAVGCMTVSLLTTLWQSYCAANTNPTKALTSNQ